MMKKILNAAIAIGVVSGIAICAFIIGFDAGVCHAITDSEVYLPKGYIESIADDGFKFTTTEEFWKYVEDNTCQVEIVLDDNVYVHDAILSD